jgi:hypothetical protein
VKQFNFKTKFLSLAVAAFFLFSVAPALAVDPMLTMDSSEVAASKKSEFSNAVIQAAVSAQKKGQIKRLELLQIRLAMLSPSVRARAEDLVVMDLAASGIEGVYTLGADGKIDRSSIDWDQLLAFIEKLIPIILDLIKLFAVDGRVQQFVTMAA